MLTLTLMLVGNPVLHIINQEVNAHTDFDAGWKPCFTHHKTRRQLLTLTLMLVGNPVLHIIKPEGECSH